MKYWWVNQNQTWRDEIDGGYMWSPKRRADNARNHFYDTMRVVAPGDLVFSFVDTKIWAIGVAQSIAYESPKPAEFGKVGSYWHDVGWRVDVAWQRLHNLIRPKDCMSQLVSYLPAKYSPLSSTGNGFQGVYLTEVGAKMADTLIALIGSEAEETIKLVSQAEPTTDVFQKGINIKELLEDQVVQELKTKPGLTVTECEAIVKSRRGQGVYRQELMKIEKECRITHVDNPVYLIASHIKPWRHSDNDERLDGENGLLLCPNMDLLFDRGLISFENNGDVVISPVADKLNLPKLGLALAKSINVGGFTSSQRKYLDFHRSSILLKAS
jgi:putative restriction endonuclease